VVFWGLVLLKNQQLRQKSTLNPHVFRAACAFLGDKKANDHSFLLPAGI
jgi:hypothetical protein